MLIEKNPECIFNEIEDTAVILNPSTEKFIELNATGLLIWKELDQTNNLNELIYPIIKLCLLTSLVKFLIVTSSKFSIN